MRTILKIIAAPFVLALILAVAVLSFLSCIAGAFCWLACTAFVLLAVCGLFAFFNSGSLPIFEKRSAITFSRSMSARIWGIKSSSG